jgi:hypothetical protein
VQWDGSSVGVGVIIHGCGGGEWEDDMMREENNFKLNSLANKTFEKLTMGVVNCPPSFSGFRLKPREGGMGI